MSIFLKCNVLLQILIKTDFFKVVTFKKGNLESLFKCNSYIFDHDDYWFKIMSNKLIFIKYIEGWLIWILMHFSIVISFKCNVTFDKIWYNLRVSWYVLQFVIIFWCHSDIGISIWHILIMVIVRSKLCYIKWLFLLQLFRFSFIL